MNKLIPLLTLLTLAGTQAASLEAKSSVTYFGTAGSLDKWSAKAPIESLQLEFDPAKPLQTKFKVTVKPDKFDSGNGIRDDNARGNVFQTQMYPEITLTSLEVKGNAKFMTIGEARDFQVRAKLNLHGISKEITIPVKATWNGAKLSATSSFTLNIEDYKITRPSILVVQVDEKVRLEVNLETQQR